MPDEAEERVLADEELLAIATEILGGEGFKTTRIAEPGWPFVVAENRYFIVAVVAAATVHQLLLAEEHVVFELTARMKEADLGAKAWDGYVILLTQEVTLESSQVTRDIFSVNYDTSSVRRIAHSGVGLTLAEVRKALAPFVKPVELEQPLISQDPFEPFIAALEDRGIDSEFARSAVNVFQRGGKIDDVI